MFLAESTLWWREDIWSFIKTGNCLVHFEFCLCYLLERRDFVEEERFELLLFSVKSSETSPNEFELLSPVGHMWLEATNENKRFKTLPLLLFFLNAKKRNKWVAVCGENISRKLDMKVPGGAVDEEKKSKVLSEVRNVEGNKVCADCDAMEPTWISLNYGVVVCHECSGVHRKLGAHISKIRSLTLDSIETEVLDFLLALGNSKANSTLEAELDRRKPTSGSSREVREEFIKQKYEGRVFCPKVSGG